MAKKKKKTQESTAKAADRAGQAGSSKFLETSPHYWMLAVLFLLLLIFFSDVIFGDKTFLPPDKAASKSFQSFVEDAMSQGIYPLWNPYIFSGMPSFASLTSAPYVDMLGNLMRLIAWPFKKIFPSFDFAFYFLNYLAFAFFTYLLLFKKTGNRYLASFAAAVMVFQPNVIAFATFGHGTKLTTAALIPVIFFLLDEFLEKRRLHYFALLALAVGLQLLRAHTQMAYYTFMMIGLYLIFWMIHARIRKSEWAAVIKPATSTVLALLIGVAMSAWLYLSVLEYADYSIRGGEAGLDYGYATSWSFAPKEIATFFIPSFFGFGGQIYWGGMPWTDFPLYMGIVPLMLAIAALLIRRDKYTVFFSLMGVLALLVSFGNFLPILYGPLFEFLPFFNKFRIPSMILILLQFSVVTLAAFGLKQILDLKDEALQNRLKKYVYVFVGVCGLLMLFLLAAKATYLDWAAASGKGNAQTHLSSHEMAAADSVRVFILALAAGVIILLYAQKKIRAQFFLIGITAVALIDLWVVDARLVEPQPKVNESRYFAETRAVQYLKTIDAPFRIYQAFDDKSPNWYIYHKIQNIQGYHAAKIKIYQEFLEKTKFDPSVRNRFGLSFFLDKYYDVALRDGQAMLRQRAAAEVDSARFKADQAVLNMLNVKYLISHYPLPDDGFKMVVQDKPFVFENTNALPRAFFVENVRIMPDVDVFYDYLMGGDFDPGREAVLHHDVGQKIEGSADNEAELVSFANHEIVLKTDVRRAGLLVLSDVYYPAGWRAYVDGKETEIYRTNGILRSIFVDPGQHEVRFEFKPSSFRLGLTITIAAFLLVLGLLVYDLKFRNPEKLLN